MGDNVTNGTYSNLLRWSPGKNPTNSIHVVDVAGGAWACANWMANQGRKAADKIAGVKIPFHNDKSKVKEVEGMIPHDQNPVAPLFNLVPYFRLILHTLFTNFYKVDDSNSTLVSTGKTIASFFGTTFEFFNLVESAVFKVGMDRLYPWFGPDDIFTT